MRDEVARFCPEDLPQYERFLERPRKTSNLALKSWAAFRTTPWATCWCSASMGQDERVAQHFPHGLQRLQQPQAARGDGFHPLLIGGNPMSVTCIYSPINTLERRFGVHWAMGGTGAIISAMVKLLESLGGSIRSDGAVARVDARSPGRRPGQARRGARAVDGAENSLRPTSWCPTPTRCGPTRTSAEPQYRKRWTNRRIQGSRHSMSLFVRTSRADEAVPPWPPAPHDGPGPALRGLARRDIFKRHIVPEDFGLLYLHHGPPPPTPSMAPAGCDAFYVLSPVFATWIAVPTGPKRPSPTGWPLPRLWSAACCPACSNTSSARRVTTPLDFQDRPPS